MYRCVLYCRKHRLKLAINARSFETKPPIMQVQMPHHLDFQSGANVVRIVFLPRRVRPRRIRRAEHFPWEDLPVDPKRLILDFLLLHHEYEVRRLVLDQYHGLVADGSFPPFWDYETEVLVWDKIDHYGDCGQSCGCCRALAGDVLGVCQPCKTAWILSTVNKNMLKDVQQYHPTRAEILRKKYEGAQRVSARKARNQRQADRIRLCRNRRLIRVCERFFSVVQMFPYQRRAFLWAIRDVPFSQPCFSRGIRRGVSHTTRDPPVPPGGAFPSGVFPGRRIPGTPDNEDEEVRTRTSQEVNVGSEE